ncbi:hypothetical protein LUZ60_000996 [Juncus effusus]|nr:hypothetical protein LUZ60_000996 [Juncus effusus]
MTAEKEKKARVAEEGGGVDPNTVKAVEKLQEIQDELEAINVKASDDILEVEQKFNEVRRPIFAKRNEVIQSIHEFWSTALLSHPILGGRLNEEDEKILKYMIALDVEEAKDVKSGYSISFVFSPNPFFENEKLTKTYSFDEKGILSISCEPIKWKDGKGFSNGEIQDKGSKRPYTPESFLSWFNNKSAKYGIVDDIAEIIKEDLWTNPLRHFQNEVDARGIYEGGDDEEVNGEEYGEDNEDEEAYNEEDDDKEYNEEDGDDEEEEEEEEEEEDDDEE